MSLQEQFNKFSVFGVTGASGSGGPTIALSQIDKWFKQAKVFDKKFTTTDTGICFGKLKQKKINYSDFNKFIDDICNTKKMDRDAFVAKLVNCGDPGMSGATKAMHGGGVDRLTDTSKYTGAHKERFDESGKGKGISGRENLVSNDGYVGAYKGKGTYDKTH